VIIRDLFLSDVTRDIPPVVYFHEQAPEKLASEVSEYIITGGWPESHPNHQRVPDGIHEQYVRLINAISSELDRAGGPDLPNAWISGFYGSGKSSFAKLFGLALDGVALPDNTSLAEALLRRDVSPRNEELRKAWNELRRKIEPLSVVFDIGGIARDNEHIHSAAVRQVQKRLGYCSTEPLVADFELKLERDGEWRRFEEKARSVLGRPWSAVKDRQLAEEDFSHVLSVLYPEKYTDPMSWYTSRAGTNPKADSPEEAATSIRDMLKFRKPGATLFLVVDEVSQYVLSNKDRVDRLRAFATALGSRLQGKAWLVALGQQKLDEAADDSFLVWAKDRFPPKLRVHLAATNIRDVVHRRLLQKRPDVEAQLRELFEKHRADLKLFAYGCDQIMQDDFVDVYPMLPGHVDLLLRITTALRTRSARAQGDDQAIRGLLQLLGELFRVKDLANMDVKSLVTLDQVYDVQHTALDSDVQASMARIMNQCANDATDLSRKAAKAVALLELIQEVLPTDAKLVAQCLYDRLDRGSQVNEITEALEDLRRRNLLGYSEKQGYKIQSTAGEEWERERRDIGVPRDEIATLVQEALKFLLASPERPRLDGRSFPWAGIFSDGRRLVDSTIADPRDEATVPVDFRFLVVEDRTESAWVKKSAETALHNRIIWVAGDTEHVEQHARELQRSRAMTAKYRPRRESLVPARKLLLQQEENRAEDLERELREAVASAWMSGRFYFRSRPISPQEQGATFGKAVLAVANRVLPELYPHFVSTSIAPGELLQLVEHDLSGPSPKFLTGELGILELDSGRYVPSCGGVVPRRVLEHIESEGGVGGAALLVHFGGPPYGYTPAVVKACVAGLLRGGKLRVQPEGGGEITAIRDAGVRDLFEKDRDFRRASFFPAGEDDIGVPARAKICKFFERDLKHSMEREDNAIADAVSQLFPVQAQRLRAVLAQFDKLPGVRTTPSELSRFNDALEHCVRSCRQTKPTVVLVKKHLEALQDGAKLLNLFEAELTDKAVTDVCEAASVRDFQFGQLLSIGAVQTDISDAGARIEAQLRLDRPWKEIVSIAPDLELVRSAYAAERSRLLEWQEKLVEQARSRVKSRDGFATLTADQEHKVLRPLADVVTSTTSEAVAPPLDVLRAPFEAALKRAEDEANDRLDQILSEGERPLIVKVDLGIRNREVGTEAEVESLVSNIRERLLEQVRAGQRVRIV
jgi:hypothetical protein